MVLLSTFSARFALRRGVLSAAVAWAVLGTWVLSMYLIPLSVALAIMEWSNYAATFAFVAGCFAALYLSRRLRLSIRAAVQAPG